MVYNVVFWLNTFPHNDGVHPTISPRTLITGLAIDYRKHCKLAFGTYIQVHKEGDSSLRPRTSGAIALRPTGNEQGGHYFLSLHSGKRLNRYAWTELPMPNEVIAQIHRLAAAAEKYDGIVFTDIQGNALAEQLDEAEDRIIDEHTIAFEATAANENHTAEQYNHDNDDTNDDRDVESETENGSESDNTNVYIENQSDQLPDEDKNGNNSDNTSAASTEDTDIDELEDPYAQSITIDDRNIMTEMNTSQLATQQEEQEQPPTHGYDLRPRPTKQKEQMSLAITGVDAGTDGQYLTIHPKVHAHVILTQMNIKQGLLTFGEKGSQAISKELKQLHDKGAITPIQHSDMTTEERKNH